MNCMAVMFRVQTFWRFRKYDQGKLLFSGKDNCLMFRGKDLNKKFGQSNKSMYKAKRDFKFTFNLNHSTEN